MASTFEGARAEVATTERPPLGDTWPLRRFDVVVLVALFAGLTAVWTGVGLLFTGPLEDSALVRADQDVSEWFVDRRTPMLDDWATAGALLADTFVKIIVTALIAGIMLAVWRNWRDPLMVAIPLVLEASVFITVTWLVGRPRPDVPRLEDSPVASSFPSGHTAAAAAYSAIAVVVFWRFRNVWVRAAVVVLVVAIPIIVGVARVYAGMHYLTDVVAGVLLGLASVLVVWLVLRGREVAAAT